MSVADHSLIVVDEEDELAADDGGLTKPVGSQTQPGNAPRKAHASGAIQTPPVSKGKGKASASAAPEISAVAALRAKKASEARKGEVAPKRDGASTTVGYEGTLPQDDKVQTAPNSKAPATQALQQPPELQSRTKHLQTPVSKERPEVRAGPRPTPGKLQPQKHGMFAKTPLALASTSEATARKGIEDDAMESDSDGSDIVVHTRGTTKRGDGTQTTKGALKRPARALLQPIAKARKSTYDVPDSPEDEPARPLKKTRTSRASPVKRPATSARTTARNNRQQQPAKSVSKAGAKAKERQNHVDEEDARSVASGASKATASRARMKTASQVMQSTVAADQASRKASAQRTKPGPHDKQNLQPIPGSIPADETFEDFERDVMQYDADNIGDDIGNDSSAKEVTVNLPSKEVPSATHHSPSNDPLSRDAQVHNVPEKQIRGASQQDAIVLSDRQEPSSPLQSPPKKIDKELTGAQGQDLGSRVPKTPSIFPSSPPLRRAAGITGAQGAAGSALVNTDTAKKATIISFDRSGPRNQGSLSAKKVGAGSLLESRTSLPPNVFLGSDQSGRSKYAAERLHGRSSAVTTLKSAKTTRAALPVSNVAESVTEALAGFTKKHPPTTNAKMDTVVQTIAAPKPNVHAPLAVPRVVPDDDFTYIDDFDGPTLVDDHASANNESKLIPQKPLTASQTLMPAPAKKVADEKMPRRAPTVPSMAAAKGHTASQKAVVPAADTSRAPKRALDSETNAESPKKRPRTTQTSRENNHASTEASLATRDVQKIAKQALSRSQTQQPLEPARRASRKPSRQASQNKVDMHGSPIPEGLIVADTTTALETYSQQAKLSSDAPFGDVTATRKATAVDKSDHILLPPDLPPPSRQPEVLSSNRKVRPAGPQEESQAITRVVARNAKKLFVQDDSTEPSTDPFTSSEEERKEPRGGSKFANELKRMTVEAQVQNNAAVHEQEVDHDPDKTLVEPEQPLYNANKRVQSYSSDSSSDMSAVSDNSSASVRNLATWRNALKPHELNLFDELVHVSHRVVRHLVDRETAATDIVDDYRRRGTTLIEQMELSHAQEYQKYVETLKERKKRLRKGLSECSLKLKGVSVAVANGQQRDYEQTHSGVDVQKKLQSVLNRYC